MTATAIKTPARVLKKTMDWSYTRALHFTRENIGDARDFAKDQGISVNDALVQLAIAEADDA